MQSDRADEHLRAELELTRVSVPRKALRWFFALVDAATGGIPTAPDVDLVVRRLDSGAEVLRTHADVGEPEQLLASVRADLAAMSVAEFFAEWRLADPR